MINKKTQQYTTQKLSRFADLKIRARLFVVLLQRMRMASVYSSRAVAFGLMCAVLVATVAPFQIGNYRVAKFISKAEAAEADLNRHIQEEIYHHRFVVREGKDKAAYVAKVKNIPMSDAASVALRQDTIEEWRHQITNLSIIETDVLDKPVDVRLNLENKDHMHIFEFKPKNCTEQEKINISSAGCNKKSNVTETYRAHRKIFDEVHNIQSNYENEIAYNDKPSEPIVLSKKNYLGTVKEGDNRFRVFVEEKDGVETRYFFDSETYLLKKRIIAVVKDETRYEMAEIIELESSFIPASENSKIFNPKKYAFEQKQVIPLEVKS